MRRTLWATSAVMIAAIANTTPSKSALHPATATCGLNEADLSGSGFEVRRVRTVHGNSRSDRPDADLVSEWRAMAARCRDLARWQNAEARDVLLKLADEYDARAKRRGSVDEG
jgi:hypothetical protein